MADRSVEAGPAFAEIEEQIASLDERIEQCGRAILLSRFAVWVGGGTLVVVLTILGSLRTPPIVFGALTTVLGGLVWLGASHSSLRELESERSALGAQREKLFDAVAIRNGWTDLTSTIH